MLLLPEEPAGDITTCAAGAAEFTASLTWRCPEEMPTGPSLSVLPGSETGRLRCSVTENDEPEECTRRISARIRALDGLDLTAALDAALRVVNETATLTEALLEARSVRLASPWTFPAPVRELLARDLKDARFEVRFAPVWTPFPGTIWEDAPVADVALGVRGAEEEVRSLLEDHPSWRIASGPPESFWHEQWPE